VESKSILEMKALNDKPKKGEIDCQECGSMNPENAKFCWKCGAGLPTPKKAEREDFLDILSREEAKKEKIIEPMPTSSVPAPEKAEKEDLIDILSQEQAEREKIKEKRKTGRIVLTSMRILGMALVLISVFLPWVHVSISKEWGGTGLQSGILNLNMYEVSSLGSGILSRLVELYDARTLEDYGLRYPTDYEKVWKKADDMKWNSIGAIISLVFGALGSYVGAKVGLICILGWGEFTYFCILPLQDLENYHIFTRLLSPELSSIRYTSAYYWYGSFLRGIGIGYFISLLGWGIILLSGVLSWIYEKRGGIVTAIVMDIVIGFSGLTIVFILADLLLLIFVILGLTIFGAIPILFMKHRFTALQIMLTSLGILETFFGYEIIQSYLKHPQWYPASEILLGYFFLISGLVSIGCIVPLQIMKRRHAKRI